MTPRKRRPPRAVALAAKLLEDYLQGMPSIQPASAEEIIRLHYAKIGRKGGKRRAKSLTPEQRAEIGRKGARARWQKKPPDDPAEKTA